MRARTYAPSLGRFLQADPILHAGGMNLYAYVGNDPVNFADPWGLCTGSRIPRTDCSGIAGFHLELFGKTGGGRGGGAGGGAGVDGIGADGVDSIIVTGIKGTSFNDFTSLPGVTIDTIVVTARKLERWNEFNLVLGDPIDALRAFGSVYAPMSDATGTEYQVFIGHFEGRPNALYRSPVTSGPRGGGSANS